MIWVDVIKEKYSFTDKLGFGISACDVIWLGKNGGMSFRTIGSVYAWELNITMKHLLLSQYCPLTLKGTKRQQNGQMGQNIQNWKSIRNTTRQGNSGIW